MAYIIYIYIKYCIYIYKIYLIFLIYAGNDIVEACFGTPLGSKDALLHSCDL